MNSYKLTSNLFTVVWPVGIHSPPNCTKSCIHATILWVRHWPVYSHLVGASPTELRKVVHAHYSPILRHWPVSSHLVGVPPLNCVKSCMHATILAWTVRHGAEDIFSSMWPTCAFLPCSHVPPDVQLNWIFFVMQSLVAYGPCPTLGDAPILYSNYGPCLAFGDAPILCSNYGPCPAVGDTPIL